MIFHYQVFYLLFCLLTTAVFANQVNSDEEDDVIIRNFFQNPICKGVGGGSDESPNFEVTATIIFSDKLLLVVQEGNDEQHFVYQIDPSDVHLDGVAPGGLATIYNLHTAQPRTMTERWGFDPAQGGSRIATAFGYTQLHKRETGDGEEVVKEEQFIGFVYEQGGRSDQVLSLSASNSLEDVFDLTSGHCTMATKGGEDDSKFASKRCTAVLGSDNQGYFFGFSPLAGGDNRSSNSWYVQECLVEKDNIAKITEQELLFSPPQFRVGVMMSDDDDSFLIKKVSSATLETGDDEQFQPLDWTRFSGFILDEHVLLFTNQSVFVFTVDRQNDIEEQQSISYVKRSYADFFRCHPPPESEEEEEYDSLFGDFLRDHESSQSPSMNQILLGLVVIVAISFCIRSQIMKRKLAQYNKLQRCYYHQGY